MVIKRAAFELLFLRLLFIVMSYPFQVIKINPVVKNKCLDIDEPPNPGLVFHKIPDKFAEQRPSVKFQKCNNIFEIDNGLFLSLAYFGFCDRARSIGLGVRQIFPILIHFPIVIVRRLIGNYKRMVRPVFPPAGPHNKMLRPYTLDVPLNMRLAALGRSLQSFPHCAPFCSIGRFITATSSLLDVNLPSLVAIFFGWKQSVRQTSPDSFV
jgi:hypothetical protein